MDPDGRAVKRERGNQVDERDYYTESKATKPAMLNCPSCRTQDSYDLQWVVRTKKAVLPTKRGKK